MERVYTVRWSLKGEPIVVLTMARWHRKEEVLSVDRGESKSQEHDNCQDHGKVDATQGVVEVDDNQHKRSRAECDDENGHNGTEGTFWLDLKVKFQNRWLTRNGDEDDDKEEHRYPVRMEGSAGTINPIGGINLPNLENGS